ncbi:MAG: polysulfide reductase NrfD [Chloroflexi bacterium]|nr:polysulfide reductase NrfD [Chloroflexota bacterium]
MQERRDTSFPQINQDLLRGVIKTPIWFWLVLGALGMVVLGGAGAMGYLFYVGLGLTGLNWPVMWGAFITTFVFWVGISHAGVMLSAILRLTHAEWRRPATRAAEVLTVFSLATAALFPIIHVGRPWRALYWIFPYDFARGIWPNIRSPLIWDPAAIFTYLTGSSLFVYIALLPDLAAARDHTTGWRHTLYSVISLGFRGTARQWRLQVMGGILLSALILPVFVSVHSIVSWDFGMTMAVSGWHVTIFAPYFVIGAVHSGVAAVVTLLALMRWVFGWQDYIRREHFDALGRLMLVVSTAWLYFFFMEFLFALYSGESAEIALREMQVFTPPWSYFFITFLLTAYFIPVPLWLFRGVRRSVPLMFLTSLSVNIGMWLERFLIFVPGLARKQVFTFDWYTYRPSAVEITIIAASFAVVALGVLLFSKFFPLVPIYDVKEGEVFSTRIEVGRRKVPAVVREE